MLHHVSFNARDPRRVAEVLADLLDAAALRAPHPPFPREAWFVCLGDDHGTLLEIMPWGETRDATTPRGVGHDAEMRPSSGAHILIGTALSAETILERAKREEWRAEISDAGLFKFVKLWVENAFLVEFLTPEFANAYREAFGPRGIGKLDENLRALEQKIASAK